MAKRLFDFLKKNKKIEKLGSYLPEDYTSHLVFNVTKATALITL